MKQYLDLLKHIQTNGVQKEPARDNMPTSKSIFGYQNRYNLADGFPAVTTKKLYWKAVVKELVWFLKGDSNIKFMVDNGCNIWNQDAYGYYKRLNPESTVPYNGFLDGVRVGFCNYFTQKSEYTFGDTGAQYPRTWRNFAGKVDQITNLIDGLRNNPMSRRHVVTATDPANECAVFPCHSMFQFNCRPLYLFERSVLFSAKYPNEFDCYKVDHYDFSEIPKYILDCQLYQRSADTFLGVPFNIASYSLLIHVVAKMCNMIPGEFIHTFGDAHIYSNHTEQVELQLTREAMPLPTLKINSGSNGWHYLTVDEVVDSIDLDLTFTLENYKHHPAIKAELKTGL